MLLDKECIECIINQSTKVANAINASPTLAKNLNEHVRDLSVNFSFESTPPQIASYVYADMSKIAKKYDLYDELKLTSTTKALSFVPLLEQKLKDAKDKLYMATKIAVAGNVIDLAAQVEFDLQNELDTIFDMPFAYDDFNLLQERLKSASSVVILGDNVGEHIFDKIFLATLKELYPSIRLYYMVRGTPIINDITIKEALEAKIDQICEIVDSGVDTPGFDYARADDYAKRLFDTSDMIISKGMGNYESLSPSHRGDICFLLKVKCAVVARSLKKEIGDIICKIV